ncbi:hypothetical protein AB9F39_37195, partial [Rhizobium leguminosarum]
METVRRDLVLLEKDGLLPWVMNIQPSRVAVCAASFPITA